MNEASTGFKPTLALWDATMIVAGTGIFILRKNRPMADRPYKAIGYPVLPALYILLAATFCLALIVYKPVYTWPGLIIVLIGIPIYFITARNSKAVG